MMFLGSFIMIAGTVIQVAAIPGHGAFAQFVVGRIITGVGNGANTSTIPSWVAECTKSHNRGKLICIEASMVAVGTLIAYWIDFGISYVDGDVSWRFRECLPRCCSLVAPRVDADSRFTRNHSHRPPDHLRHLHVPRCLAAA
jgi:MFS family permease